MANDEYYTLEPKPRRSRRFLQLVAKHALLHKLKQAHEYRSKFIERIDKLRNIERVSELKQVEKVEPKAPKSEEYIESQIRRMLDIEQYLEDEMNFNRQILSRLSENDTSQLTLLKKVLEKEKIDESKLALLDDKIKQIDQLKQSIRKLRESVESMVMEEKRQTSREKGVGMKMDILSAKFEDEEKMLISEMGEMKAMRERLEKVSTAIESAKARKARKGKKAAPKKSKKRSKRK